MSKNQSPHINGTRRILSLSLFSSMANCVSSMNGDNIDERGSLSPSYAEIIIVRHGETDWNASAKMQGQLDVELNDIGRKQAATVADRLSKEPKISAIYSSDLKRALDTAEIIAAKCGGLEVIKDQGLRERHLGDLQGLVYHDLAKVNSISYSAFASHRTDQELPGGGESLDQLYQRVVSSVQRIGEKHRGERVVLVSHGGSIRSIYKRAAPKGRSPGRVLNTSVGVIRVSDGDMWTVESWGDVSHLKQDGFLQSGFGGDASSG